MDIRKFAVSPTTDVHLKNPATDMPLYDGADEKGNPDTSKPIVIQIFGPGSKEYREAGSIATNKQIKRGKKGLTAQVINEDRIGILVACTFGFKNFNYGGGAFSPDTVRALYTDPEMGWVREQVEEQMGDFGNFLTIA
jgi:hypothetical protein